MVASVMSRLLLRATVTGTGTNGVIHVGFRRWAVQLAIDFNCDCTAENTGDTVKLVITGRPIDVRVLLAKLRYGPPGSRVLGITIDKEELVHGME